ncbi:hypothetical protein [Anaerolentibacter hominis]|uniref:hypothetical protein n=1 Tax=Anaerolentibacter hominis TaxID=3079009 RepID=UPI0031B7F4D2
MATVENALQLYQGAALPAKAMQTLQKNVEGAEQKFQSAARSITIMQNNIQSTIMTQNNFAGAVEETEKKTNGLADKLKQIASAGFEKAAKGIGQMAGASLNAANVQMEAETRLDAVMRQKLGANDAAIAGTKALAAEQQRIGVISDEAQMSGAGQLATFLSTSSALNTLIPAMNNLAVQQNGLNTTSNDMVSIGSALGQAMQGQTGALTNMGISMSAAQEQILQYGTEQERAAMLSQLITDNVGNMNAAMGSTPMGQIQQMENAWNGILEKVGTALYPVIVTLLNYISENMPMIQEIMGTFGAMLGGIAEVASGLLDIVFQVVGFFVDNWSLIAPIIGGIAVAFGLYTAAVKANSIMQNINAAATGAMQFASKVHAASLGMQRGATMKATTTQYGFNAALLACPLVQIILLIIGVVAAIFLVVGAINKFMGTSISAVGVVAGVFMTAFGFIWNIIADVANFLGNVWEDPIGAAIRLFANLADNCLAAVELIAKGIDFLFKTNFADKVAGFRSSLSQKVEQKFGKDTEYVKKMNLEEQWNKGYDWGEGVQNDLTKSKDNAFDLNSLENGIDLNSISDRDRTISNLDGIYGGVNETAQNTAAMADSMTASNEELSYLREIAEREAINQYTTAEVKLDFSASAQINNDMDLDGFVNVFAAKIEEAMVSSAEGVHA